MLTVSSNQETNKTYIAAMVAIASHLSIKLPIERSNVELKKAGNDNYEDCSGFGVRVAHRRNLFHRGH